MPAKSIALGGKNLEPVSYNKIFQDDIYVVLALFHSVKLSTLTWTNPCTNRPFWKPRSSVSVVVIRDILRSLGNIKYDRVFIIYNICL